MTSGDLDRLRADHKRASVYTEALEELLRELVTASREWDKVKDGAARNFQDWDAKRLRQDEALDRAENFLGGIP